MARANAPRGRIFCASLPGLTQQSMRKAGWFVFIRTFVARRASVWTTRSGPVVTTLREARHARRVTSVCAAAVQQKDNRLALLGRNCGARRSLFLNFRKF
jgi:hypothetical protein